MLKIKNNRFHKNKVNKFNKIFYKQQMKKTKIFLQTFKNKNRRKKY